MSKLRTKPASGLQETASLAKISRRTFGRHAAAAALSLSPAALLGGAPELPSRLPIEQASDSMSRGVGPRGGTPDATQEVDAKLANIVRKYGSRLSEEQRARLRRILTYNQKMMDSIRAFPLQNGDPPASVLKVSFEEKVAGARQGSASRRAIQSSKRAKPEGKVR